MNVARPPSALNALRPPDNRPGARFRARSVLVAVAVIFFAVLTTEPRVPYEWDAAAWWIPRAEMEREHSGRLLAMMRTPEEWGLLLPGIGTHVYPIAYPMVVGALARLLPPNVSALRASGAWLALLVAVLLVQIGRRLDDTDGALAVLPLALVLLSPFTIVHARSGYADLSVGLLGALLVLAMDTAFDRATMTRLVWMVLVSTVLLQTKQDGLVICTAVAVSAAVVRHHRTSTFWRVTILEFFVIIANAAGWWVLVHWLYGPQIPPTFRALVGFDLRVSMTFGYQVARHALDIDTWGVLWPTLVVWAYWRRDRRWLVFVGAALAGYGLTHVMGPGRLLQFLRDGAVMNRLLLQIAVTAVPFTVDRLTARRLEFGREQAAGPSA